MRERVWRLRPTILAALAVGAFFIPRITGWPFAVAALVLVLFDVRRVGRSERLGTLVAALLAVGIPTVLILWWARVLWVERTDSGANIGGELLHMLGYALLPVGTLIQMADSEAEPPASVSKSLVAFSGLCAAVSVIAVLVPQR